MKDKAFFIRTVLMNNKSGGDYGTAKLDVEGRG